jgi:small subunit ribosomal protein S2
MISTLSRERRKITRNLDGIRKMNRLPGALVLIDVRREHIAAKEAHKLKIPVVGLIDTDSDPDLVDIPIPGNDDAMRAIELVLDSLGDAIEEGKRSRSEEGPSGGGQEPGGGGGAPQPRGGRGGRRSSRASGRAEEPQRPEEDSGAESGDAGTIARENPAVAAT